MFRRQNEDAGKVIELAVTITGGLPAGFELQSSGEARARANALGGAKSCGTRRAKHILTHDRAAAYGDENGQDNPYMPCLCGVRLRA